jgi:hypothetical protein
MQICRSDGALLVFWKASYMKLECLRSFWVSRMLCWIATVNDAKMSGPVGWLLDDCWMWRFDVPRVNEFTLPPMHRPPVSCPFLWDHVMFVPHLATVVWPDLTSCLWILPLAPEALRWSITIFHPTWILDRNWEITEEETVGYTYVFLIVKRGFLCGAGKRYAFFF